MKFFKTLCVIVLVSSVLVQPVHVLAEINNESNRVLENNEPAITNENIEPPATLEPEILIEDHVNESILESEKPTIEEEAISVEEDLPIESAKKEEIEVAESEEPLSEIPDESLTFRSRINPPNEWGNIDYTAGLTVFDGAGTDIRTWINQHYLAKKDTYFLIKSKEGKYAYSKIVKLPNYTQRIDGALFSLIGGEVDAEAKQYGVLSSKNYYFQFKPDFYSFYEGATKKDDPCKGKDLNFFLNWVNHWSYEEISIVEMDAMAIDHYVRGLNKGIDYQLEQIDYTKGLTASDGHDTDIRTSAYQHYLRKKNTYFLIKTKEGKYAYGKSLELPRNSGKVDGATFAANGGEADEVAKKYKYNPAAHTYYFQYKPEFYTFYEGTAKNYDPCSGKDLNYFLNWLSRWSDDEVSIVEMDAMAIDHYVRGLNKGIDYQLEQIDYTKGLTASDGHDTDIRTSAYQHYLRKKNTYFLIKTKEGKYAYGKSLDLALTNQKIDGATFNKNGGEANEAANKYKYYPASKTYYFQFKPAFYSFYEGTAKKYDPCSGEDLNYFLNWINHWAYEDVSLVTTENIELYVAKKNLLVIPWRFYEEGRSSKKDHIYSLNLSDVTRLNFKLKGSTTKTVKVYSQQEKKIYETKCSNGTNTFQLDLPAGDYYIVMTDLFSETTFQMTKSSFKELELSIDTTTDQTKIHINGVFNQELTDLYAKYDTSRNKPDVVQVMNTLVKIWRKPFVYSEALDDIFGKDHLKSIPLLYQYPLTNLGNISLGDIDYTAPLQYLGQGKFFSKNNIFTMNTGLQSRFFVLDDMLYAALLYEAVVFTAHVVTGFAMVAIVTNSPKYDVGDWEKSKAWHTDGSATYNGKTYGINEETGDIRDVATGEDLPESVISSTIKEQGAGITIAKLTSLLSELNVEPDEDYEWYTFKDLVADELAGGHTMEKHIGKSDAYLNDRFIKEETWLFSSTYDNVLSALIAINIARIKSPDTFKNVNRKLDCHIDTERNSGRGFSRNGTKVSQIKKVVVSVLPSSSKKGYRILTSYPKP